ncbi:hypothetical protein C8F04DRAFT_1070849 [Mycena alexandri]|uniref:Uncharacterized protein n=1 Tax=Mycena alexandri TaxID=1745969 RepID=A0AAD6TEL0_9AGAR|nr:hypothetical protein C8F04DRAFT_1070849 [Mycena alexandri]
MSNPGYANLLAHLHNSSTSLPLPTIQSALAHHLAKLSPLPTPLAASIVSSPLFSQHPFTHPKLQTLFTAFRHATHLKYRDAKDAEEQRSAVGAVFSRGTAARVKQWMGAVLKGIKGGQPILRLACCGGLLAGLEDLKTAEQLELGRSQLEDEVIISVAESMDVYAASTAGGWEAEFQPAGDVDTMTLALILASRSLVVVVPSKLKALPLPVLTSLLVFTVASAFASGTFLSTASSPNAIALSPTLRAMNESPLMEFIAPISKLTALTITILSESRPAEGITAAAAALDALRPVSKSLESDWIGSSLARNDNSDTRELVWKTLKTLLFANIMIADAALSALVFVSPAAYTGADAVPVPSALALTVLHTLCNLSFVISQFGGVTTTASPGFVELKKTFYLALDILAKSEEESDRFARELSLELRAWQTRAGDRDPDIQAKTAYALTCIEQLVPVLSGECIQSYALPLALPYLSDPSYRETYESSHSVVLAVFASHADRHAENVSEAEPDPDARAQAGPRFTERMVPFYARCLIENSVDGRLHTPQLRLAFAALVRSACASARSGELTDDAYALAWYCVDALLDAIHALSGPDGAVSANNDDRLHRLHLTLISVVPALPLKLLPRVLEEIGTILTRGRGAQSGSGGGGGGEAKELVDAMFVEISERVGDREKELAMRWWYDNRLAFSYSEAGTGTTRPSAENNFQEQARL